MPPSKELTQAKKTAQGTTRLTVKGKESGVATDLPDVRNLTHLAMASEMQICLDLEAGITRVRAMGETYLPKSPAENADDYSRRVKVAELYNMFWRTVRGLTGMPFRRNPVLSSKLPAQMKEHWDNLDLSGTNGSVFVRNGFEKGLARGHMGFLVDFPDTGGAVYSLGTERDLQLRPYWIPVLPENIVSWRTASYQGRTVLSQVVLEFCVTEPVGRFGERERREWRVFRWEPPGRVFWDLWVEGPTGTPVPEGTGIVANQIEIPLAVSYLGPKLGTLHTRPALLDLAHTTVSHYQVLSDHRYSLHKASIPLLVATGRSDTSQPIVVGVNNAIDIPTGGSLMYVEHSGAALSASRQELQDIETRGAAQGLAMLQRESRAAETAEARRIDKSEQDSTLAVAAFNHQLAIQQAMRFHARYLKLELPAEEPPVRLNTDFQDLSFDPGMISALQNLRVANDISLDMLWDLLQAGNILPQSFDRDLERARLEDAKASDLALFTQNSGGVTPEEANNEKQTGTKVPPKIPPQARA